MSQKLDDAVTDATAAVHGDTGRFIDYEQALVLEQDMVEDRGTLLRGRRRSFGIDPDRRYANLVALLQLVFRAYPPTIDAYFTAPQQPVQASLGYARQLTAKIVINTLASLLAVNTDFADPGND